MLQTMMIKTDGTLISLTPNKGNTFTLEEMREYVNGIEDIIHLKKQKAFMVLNQEREMLNLPINKIGTKILRNALSEGAEPVLGDAVIVQHSELL